MKTFGTVRIGNPDSHLFAVACEVANDEWEGRIMLAPMHVGDPHRSGQPLSEEQARGFFPELVERTYKFGITPRTDDRAMAAALIAMMRENHMVPKHALLVAVGDATDGSGETVSRSVWSMKDIDDEGAMVAVLCAVCDTDEEFAAALLTYCELLEAEG